MGFSTFRKWTRLIGVSNALVALAAGFMLVVGRWHIPSEHHTPAYLALGLAFGFAIGTLLDALVVGAYCIKLGPILGRNRFLLLFFTGVTWEYLEEIHKNVKPELASMSTAAGLIPDKTERKKYDTLFNEGKFDEAIALFERVQARKAEGERRDQKVAKRLKRNADEDAALLKAGSELGVPLLDLTRELAKGTDVFRAYITLMRKRKNLLERASEFGCSLHIGRICSEKGTGAAEDALVRVKQIGTKADYFGVGRAARECISRDDIPGAEAVITKAETAHEMERKKFELKRRIEALPVDKRSPAFLLLEQTFRTEFKSREYRKALHKLEQLLEQK